jgi:hypothetical protein
MAKTYKLSIKLDKEDKRNIEHVLSKIAKAIDEGFTSGIDYPVNWKLKTDNGPMTSKYENFQHIDENGKALDDDYNEYRDETGCCVYVEKKYRHNFRVIKL